MFKGRLLRSVIRRSVIRKGFVFTCLAASLVVACRGQDRASDAPYILPMQDYGSASPGLMALPMKQLPLENLDAFQAPAPNWRIAGGARSDYLTEHFLQVDDGTGVLVNVPTEESRAELNTRLHHGDIELKLEVLVPKGSNSGIYLQGRYEIQVIDSWRQHNYTYSSLGGIYQRWDESRPTGSEGYEGVAPVVNASLASGLWQELHVLFRAPRFDEQGNKTRNAEFEKVFLNGMLIHEDVEVTGPTRGAVSETETDLAPLMIQGSHGPVAYRNIRYKTFSRSDSLRLGPISFKVYDYGGARLPAAEAFDTMRVLVEGVTDSFNVSKLSPRDERFAMWFSAELHVPFSGEYLFQSLIATGGNLYIDGELVTMDDGTSYFTLVGNTVHLEQGTHRLDVSYFKRRYVDPLTVIYEGPGMERRTLASSAYGTGQEPVHDPIIVQPDPGRAKLIGGFIRYGEDNDTFVHRLGHPGMGHIGMADPESSRKRMHTLSVGNPEGLHFTYDLAHPSPLRFWRGGFADVTGLWRGPFGDGLSGYGDLKIVVPLNAAVEMQRGLPIARRRAAALQFFHDVFDRLNEQEYLLDERGRPVFEFHVEGVAVEDEILPSEDGEGLIRTLRYRGDGDDLVSIVAQGEEIDHISGDLYRVKNYYVRLEDTGGRTPSIYETNGIEALAIPILSGSNSSEIRYRIIW